MEYIGFQIDVFDSKIVKVDGLTSSFRTTLLEAIGTLL